MVKTNVGIVVATDLTLRYGFQLDALKNWFNLFEVVSNGKKYHWYRSVIQ